MNMFFDLFKNHLNYKYNIIDVKDDILDNIDKYEISTVKIKSSMDIKILYGNENVFKYYLVNSDDISNINLNCKYKDKELLIDISTLINVKGYFMFQISDKIEFLEVNNLSSDTSITNISCSKLLVNSINGDIGIDNLNINIMQVISDTGDLNIKLNSEKYNINAESRYGDVSFNDIKNFKNANKQIILKSSSGDIFLQR